MVPPYGYGCCWWPHIITASLANRLWGSSRPPEFLGSLRGSVLGTSVSQPVGSWLKPASFLGSWGGSATLVTPLAASKTGGPATQPAPRSHPAPRGDPAAQPAVFPWGPTHRGPSKVTPSTVCTAASHVHCPQDTGSRPGVVPTLRDRQLTGPPQSPWDVGVGVLGSPTRGIVGSGGLTVKTGFT